MSALLRAWPRTLVGRTLLVLLAAVIISNVIGLAAYLSERRSFETGARERAIAERVVAAARLLDASAPDERRRQLWTLRGFGLRMGWSSQPAVEDDMPDRRNSGIRRAFAAELDADPGDRLRLTRGAIGRGGDDARSAGSGTGPGPGPGRGSAPRHGVAPDATVPADAGTMPPGLSSAELLRGSLRLDDGSWLNFAAPIVSPPPVWSTSMLLVIAATTFATAAVSAFAVWRASAPLSMFAAAAERLGRDLDARAMSEEGPVEVVRAARAFNEMQARLQRMIRHRLRMLAAMSHDLRTPLTRLKLRAELLDDEDQQKKTLADLDQIEALVTAGLEYVRDAFTEERAAPLDLAALVQTICAEAEDAGGAVTYTGPDRAVFVGRPVALRRAIANLVDNALKYGGAAGVALEMSGAPPHDAAEIAVTDDGPGLPESELDKVFDPFYRVEGSRSRDSGGSGLGLAIVQAAAKAHGGSVSLANRAGGGLRAVLRLPARKAAKAGGPARGG